MLNDNLFNYLHHSHTPFLGFYNPEEERRRRYLATRTHASEQERIRRYLAAQQQNAYLEELDRRRRQKEYEEEMERRRQQRVMEEAMEYERQRALYEQQEKERMRAALYAKKLRMKEKKEAERKRREAMKCHPMHQIVQGPDGHFYSIVTNPCDFDGTQDAFQNRAPVQDFRVNHGYKTTDHHPVEPASSITTPITAPLDNAEKQVFNNVIYNININKNNDDKEDSALNTGDRNNKKLKKKSFKPVKKSSILIGGVEDASDSECEDEFTQYYRNRRPRSGEWIEPVDGIQFSKI